MTAMISEEPPPSSTMPASEPPKRKWLRFVPWALVFVVLWILWKPLLYAFVFSSACGLGFIVALQFKRGRGESIFGGLIAGVLSVFALSAIMDRSPSMPLADLSSADEPSGADARDSSFDRFFEPKAGEPVFFVKAAFGNLGRSAFQFETLPGGAIRFFDAYDKMQYVVTQPFEIREARYPDFPRDKISDSRAKEIEELTKRYLITSYSTARGWRYSTFGYEMDGSGSLRFYNLDTKSFISLPPPFIIEEKLCGKGVKPHGPGFPTSQ